MPDKYTNIGSKIYFSASLPATEDVAGYAALTWTEVKGVASIPEIGGSASVVSQADLADGVVRKAHGEVDFGGGTVQYRLINADAGQGVLAAAYGSKNIISGKVLRSTGRIEYFQCIIMSNRTAEATTGNFYGVSSDMQVVSTVVYDDAGV